MNKDLIEQARLKIEQAERIMVCAHTRPDGDAVGSVCALGQALMNAGKQVQMVLSDGVPAALRFIPGSGRVVQEPEGEFDLIVVLDCGDIDRIGGAIEDSAQIDVNIDHHPDNTHFAEVNLVEPAAVSASQILAELFPAFGLEMTPQIAAGLLTGLITDTIGFRTENMNPEALRLAADLVEAGADLPELYHQALAAKSLPAARYNGAGLTQVVQDGKIVWTQLTLEDRKFAGYNGQDDADLVNVIAAIDSAVVAIIFVEQLNHQVKVSWRTRAKEIDVSQAAHHFGGGGHRPAAGAMIEGSLPQVQADVLDISKRLLFQEREE
ncbi:MAG: bifunctional oligoribonuclease/PAP phosphatase NrnA [Anaerolineales bacterium]|nr:bifunctional oligoribonuclease/PAP phosphatase NrnA [Anaerolineales bacterium]